jgi:hypothetical protein
VYFKNLFNLYLKINDRKRALIFSPFYFFNQINTFNFLLNFGARAKTNTLDTHIAEKSDTTIQIPSITQNHLIRLIQKINNITALTKEVT